MTNMTDTVRFQGLAILTVLKAGFLGSGRFGSGVVVARLSDGTWSAPSGIGTVGGGFGGQIGFELTDFVFILNDAAAVRTFAQAGSLTLGGNVSIAAGPVGRNAEAAGVASLKSVAGVFAYSKTKGLFAGVSLEGSVLIERRDTNEKLYNRRLTARALLSGEVPVPPAADPLMRVLNSRVFAGTMATSDTVYNDIPVYDSAHEDVVWQGKTGSAYGEGVRTNRTGTVSSGIGSEYEYRDNPQRQRATTWAENNTTNSPYSSPSSRANQAGTFERPQQNQQVRRTTFGTGENDAWMYNRDAKPARPTAPKPVFTRKAAAEPGQAVAKFTFEADQPGDLGFKKGDVITILKKTESETDWWTGRVGNREGIFPR